MTSPNVSLTAEASATNTTTPPTVVPSLFRAPSTRQCLGLALMIGCASGLWIVPGEHSIVARGTMMVFASAIVAWAVLRWDETPVAVVASLALVAIGAVKPETLYAGMGNELVWLMLGAFVLAAVLRSSGLAERFSLKVIAAANTPRALFYRLTWVIVATAFVIPSTSGRAALLLPVFLALASAVKNPQLVRALALLFPTVILLSACASLLGAGAHLVAVDFMHRSSEQEFDFAYWAWLGTPFAIVCSVLATEVILRLFVSGENRARVIEVPRATTAPLSQQQWAVILVVLGTVALWSTSAWHTVPAPIVALIGAVAATWAKFTGINMKQALKSVEWNLILFLAVTLVMGDALLETGAAKAIADATISALPEGLKSSAILVLVCVILLAMVAHLVITSRSARATVLIPVLALPMAMGELAPAALVFVVTVASGFCQTFSVSAKPVAVFGGLEVKTYSENDLLRLSLCLLPLIAVTILAFSLWVWPMQGLAAFPGQ